MCTIFDAYRIVNHELNGNKQIRKVHCVIFDPVHQLEKRSDNALQLCQLLGP